LACELNLLHGNCVVEQHQRRQFVAIQTGLVNFITFDDNQSVTCFRDGPYIMMKEEEKEKSVSDLNSSLMCTINLNTHTKCGAQIVALLYCLLPSKPEFQVCNIPKYISERRETLALAYLANSSPTSAISPVYLGSTLGLQCHVGDAKLLEDNRK